MAALQRAGLSTAEVLASSTIVAARAMGIANDAGSLEAGKRADLVVLDADPIADLGNIQRVRFVMRNGTLHPRERLTPVR
jgi:imidazolonepropionase-like amidohydrolase